MCETNSKACTATTMVSASGKFLSPFYVLLFKCYVPSDLKYCVYKTAKLCEKHMAAVLADCKKPG